MQHKYFNARLLILGTGYPLISALSGRLAKWTQVFKGWTQRSILSPRPLQQWGNRERQLGSLFSVLPASIQGINYLVNQLDTGEEMNRQNWSEKIKDSIEKPIEISGSLIETLQAHYSEAQVKWIAACAVYPSLHWDLSLFLGKLVEANSPFRGSGGEVLLTIDNLMKINRLPWFVEGELPKAVRLQLLHWLEKKPARLIATDSGTIASIIAAKPAA